MRLSGRSRFVPPQSYFRRDSISIAAASINVSQQLLVGDVAWTDGSVLVKVWVSPRVKLLDLCDYIVRTHR